MELFIDIVRKEGVNFNNGFPLQYVLDSKLENKWEIIKKLIDEGATSNYDYLLNKIIDEKNEEMVKFFINRKIPINGHHLEFAAQRGSIEIVKLLVEYNPSCIDYNDGKPLRRAVLNDHLEIVKYLIEHGDNLHVLNNRPLRNACQEGHIDIAKYLIEKGANVNDDNGVCLKTAISKNHFEIVKTLIEAGANPNPEKDSDIYSDYPLVLAIKHKCDNVVSYLIDHGADVNIRNGNPLNFALEKNAFDIAKYLINHGADPKFITNEKLLRKYKKYIDYPTIPRVTNESCLISHEEIILGDEYYICSNKSDHAFLKKSIDSYMKLTPETKIRCFVCSGELDENVYINQQTIPSNII